MKTLGVIALVVSILVSIGHASVSDVLMPVTDSMGNTTTVKQTLAGDDGAVVTGDGIKQTLSGE